MVCVEMNTACILTIHTVFVFFSITRRQHQIIHLFAFLCHKTINFQFVQNLCCSFSDRQTLYKVRQIKMNILNAISSSNHCQHTVHVIYSQICHISQVIRVKTIHMNYPWSHQWLSTEAAPTSLFMEYLLYAKVLKVWS